MMGKSVKEGIMPKEFIENRYFGQYATTHDECSGSHEAEGDCAGKKVPLDQSVVKVGWAKEQEHVELAILPTKDDEHFSERVWYSQFDRRGINRLIRTLRQARDDAYGKDE